MDKRLNFNSGAGISFLDWVQLYNNGEPICDWDVIFRVHKKRSSQSD